jgi:two-component system chemotaxis response regulator CheB
MKVLSLRRARIGAALADAWLKQDSSLPPFDPIYRPRVSAMKKDIVVIGTSAGGIEALRELVGGLPADFPAAVFVVLHTSPDSPGILASILERAGELSAVCVSKAEAIKPGCIYVARPDHHLVIARGLARATRGPKENRFRPAVDPLFRSAAQAYGARVIGIILTGGLDDGTVGLAAVKKLGGTAIVQDPQDALAPSMPLSALAHVEVDHCVPLAQMAALLTRLTTAEVQEKGVLAVPEQIRIEVDIAKEHNALEAGVMSLGAPSIYACPECHGVLLQVKSEAEQGHLRFRCHTGHAYSMHSLLAEMNERTEESLGSAVRAIEEHVLLLRHLASHIGSDSPPAQELLERAALAEAQRDLVRQAVLHYPDGTLAAGS